MKVYISGQISGLDIEQVRATFAKRERELIDMGHVPINPFNIAPYDPNKTWEDHMREDVKALMECDGISPIKGWVKSRGARLECSIACELGLTFIRPNYVAQHTK